MLAFIGKGHRKVPFSKFGALMYWKKETWLCIFLCLEIILSRNNPESLSLNYDKPLKSSILGKRLTYKQT